MSAGGPEIDPAAEAGDDLRWPRWLDEIDLTLSICPQFVLSGNIRDSHLIPIDDRLLPVPILHALWTRLHAREYEFLLSFDRSLGLSVYPAEAWPAAQAALRSHFPRIRDLTASAQTLAMEYRDLPALISAVYRSGACGLVVQNASRLLNSASQLSADQLALFAACAETVQSAAPRPPRRPQTQPLFNPVFWLLDSLHDLPVWLVVGGERSRAISVALPDREDRLASARQFAASIPSNIAGAQLDNAIAQFALRSEGLTLNEMAAVAHIARDRQVGIGDVADAIRYYKVGVTDDPWSKPLLRRQIANGEVEIGDSVKGQPAAVRQTLDILIRSVTGLNGAQASSSSNRPRGVLFFAGPTGVGKTELAKAVSRLVFGDEDTCLRFDMSEFSSEHSEARLIGAPPGYIGHDAGGELVNSVRQRPFSVVLFDEIEKAHPRILDKFLQILEDGRLTDGRGDTVYFSESVLIFTSNLGIVTDGPDGKPLINVNPDDDYEDVNEKVRRGIDYHFRTRLGRPELLNRLGDNIVVFDFIRREVAEQIFDRVVRNIFDRVARVRNLQLSFGEGVREALLKICTADLTNGGRGIGNKLESALVNPLARELFATDPAGPNVTITAIRHDDGKYWMSLS